MVFLITIIIIRPVVSVSTPFRIQGMAQKTNTREVFATYRLKLLRRRFSEYKIVAKFIESVLYKSKYDNIFTFSFWCIGMKDFQIHSISFWANISIFFLEHSWNQGYFLHVLNAYIIGIDWERMIRIVTKTYFSHNFVLPQGTGGQWPSTAYNAKSVGQNGFYWKIKKKKLLFSLLKEKQTKKLKDISILVL